MQPVGARSQRDHPVSGLAHDAEAQRPRRRGPDVAAAGRPPGLAAAAAARGHAGRDDLTGEHHRPRARHVRHPHARDLPRLAGGVVRCVALEHAQQRIGLAAHDRGPGRQAGDVDPLALALRAVDVGAARREPHADGRLLRVVERAPRLPCGPLHAEVEEVLRLRLVGVEQAEADLVRHALGPTRRLQRVARRRGEVEVLVRLLVGVAEARAEAGAVDELGRGRLRARQVVLRGAPARPDGLSNSRRRAEQVERAALVGDHRVEAVEQVPRFLVGVHEHGRHHRAGRRTRQADDQVRLVGRRVRGHRARGERRERESDARPQLHLDLCPGWSPRGT